MASAVLQAVTPNTITDAAELTKHIRKVRKQGWASSNEEYGLGIVGCAVRVPLPVRRSFLCVGISAPAARVSYGMLADFIDPLTQAAGKIGESLKR
jgi:DNA-binding IclR family transcriptional regulator